MAAPSPARGFRPYAIVLAGVAYLGAGHYLGLGGGSGLSFVQTYPILR